jgi:hypothetical protein
VLFFEGYARRDSRRVNEDPVLLPLSGHVLYVDLSLFFVQFLCVYLDLLACFGFFELCHEDLVNCVRYSCVVTRNDHLLAVLNILYEVIQPEITSSALYIHDVVLLALPHIVYIHNSLTASSGSFPFGHVLLFV